MESTPDDTGRRPPRTPRRSTAAAAPSTSASSRAQSAQSSSNSPIFTPTRAPPRESRRLRAQSPLESAPRPFFSEDEDEDFPTLMLSADPAAGSKTPTEVKVGWWKSPAKLARERKEREEREERRKELKARKERKRRRELEGTPRPIIPPGAVIIELSDSDEELPLPRKRKRPSTQESPRKRSRAESVIYISCGEETDTPAPCPATPPPVLDVENADGDANVDATVQMALDDPVPLDQETIANEAGAAGNLSKGADYTSVQMTSDNQAALVSSALEESALTESANPNTSDEMAWTESQMEDAKFFDAALASVTRELEDTSVPGNALVPLPTESPAADALLSSTQSLALHVPPAPSSPLSSNAHQLSAPASESALPPSLSDTKIPTPQQTTIAPYCHLHSCYGQRPSRPAWPQPRFGTKFDGVKPKRQPYRLPVRVVRNLEPEAQIRDGDSAKQDGSAPWPNLEQQLQLELEPAQGATPTPDASEGHDSTPRCDLEPALKPVHMVDVAEGVSNSRNPVPRSSLQPDDALAGDPMGREDFVPIPGAEPESPKVAPMRSSIEQDDSAPKRDSESNPEPVRAACIGYSPPPMSPKSDSTLGGTPPLIGTSVILPLALVAAQGSSMKMDIVLCEDDEDDGEELNLLYPP